MYTGNRGVYLIIWYYVEPRKPQNLKKIDFEMLQDTP